MRLVVPLVLLVLTSAAGCGTPSLLITPVSNVNRLDEVEVQAGGGWFAKKIALIEVEGMLLNARTGGFLQPSENKVSLFAQQLEMAEHDPAVKAVVLRVNSPGGTVTASDTMYQILTRFKQRTRKPVIASTQEVCASGGYYVACGADAIVVNPTSVVGSIGVIFNTFDFEGTMAKIGMRAESIKSGPLKDMGSPFDSLSPEERAIFQGLVDDYFARFVAVVKGNRTLTEDGAKVATDGRVFSGEQADNIGLADQTGLLEDAIELARQKCGYPNASVVMYKRPHGYRGSIYAADATPPAQANVVNLNLANADALLPTGFYYLWKP
jgi:protease-4